MVTLEQLKEKKKQLDLESQEIHNAIKEELNKLPFVEGLAEYIKYQAYPTDLFNKFGIDSGDYDSFGKVQLKIVYNYGYTDVVGLTKEEFEQLENLLEE